MAFNFHSLAPIVGFGRRRSACSGILWPATSFAEAKRHEDYERTPQLPISLSLLHSIIEGAAIAAVPAGWATFTSRWAGMRCRDAVCPHPLPPLAPFSDSAVASAQGWAGSPPRAPPLPIAPSAVTGDGEAGPWAACASPGPLRQRHNVGPVRCQRPSQPGAAAAASSCSAPSPRPLLPGAAAAPPPWRRRGGSGSGGDCTDPARGAVGLAGLLD